MRRLAALLLLLALGCGNPFLGGSSASPPPNHFLVVVENEAPAFTGSSTRFTATFWFSVPGATTQAVGSSSAVVQRGGRGVLDCGTVPPDGVEVNTPAFPPGFGFVLQAPGNNWPCWTPHLHYESGVVTYGPP